MKAYRLEGTSMKPLFREGGVALADRRSRRTLRPGDCAVYSLEGRTLLHRVVGTEERGAWLSDDAGLLPPHFVPWDRIEGKVVSRNPLKNGRAGRVYSKIRRLLGTAPYFYFLVPGLRRDNR